jgi:hypothetical protein
MNMVNIPIVNAPYLEVDGLQIAITGDATATVQAGRARNSTNEADIIMSVAATLDVANTGLNGLDTGTLGNDTLYALYVVGDSTNTNEPGVILSASASAPLLPVDYDMYRLIGYLRTDGTADFLAGFWSGSSNQRIFMYDAPIATAVTAGASTTDAAVSLATFVPAVQGLPVYMFFDATPAAASRVLTLKPYGAVGAPFTVTSQVTAVHVTGVALVQAQLLVGVPNIEYIWSAGGGDAVALNVAGYQYTI